MTVYRESFFLQEPIRAFHLVTMGSVAGQLSALNFSANTGSEVNPSPTLAQQSFKVVSLKALSIRVMRPRERRRHRLYPPEKLPVFCECVLLLREFSNDKLLRELSSSSVSPAWGRNAALHIS